MTLIACRLRIHFADDVLEEAFRAEMERAGSRRALVVVDDEAGEAEERLLSALPLRASAEVRPVPGGMPDGRAVRALAARYAAGGFDHLVGLGAAGGIDAAKLARLSLAREAADPAALAPLTTVPGPRGFAAAISDYAASVGAGGERRVVREPRLVPTAAICDPTLTLGADAGASARAGAATLARGVGAFLSRGFNPPADGLALDALSRVLGALPRALERDRLDRRRELMAAALNSALALSKGRGALHAMVLGLRGATARDLDVGALSAILLPGLVAHYARRTGDKAAPLGRALGLRARRGLASGIAARLADWPVPTRLSALGVEARALDDAARLAAADAAAANGPSPVSAAAARAIYEAAL
ncbi:MAG: iron-containing alcohol dehydrogenase [Paracoccaceae bacterium]